MGLHDWAAGEVASDTLLDEMARQGRIICTSTTRPTTITGMHVYETDTTLTREWQGGASWRTLPQGIVDRSTGIDTGLGGFIVGTEVGVNGSECAFTSNGSGQLYKYSWRFALDVLVSSAVFDVWCNRDGSHIGVPNPATVASTGVGNGLTVSGFIVVAADIGAHTIDMTIERTSGTGGGEIFAGGDFLLEHMGTLP